MALLIDADDTLWENIVVFDRVNEAYATWIDPGAGLDLLPAMDALQQEQVAVLGYGRETFRHSLVLGVERFGGRVARAADLAFIDELLEPLRWTSLEIRPDVVDTLEHLAARHRLVMMTKGDRAEQEQKIRVSGLAHFFDGFEIASDKSVDAYHDVVDRHDLDPAITWMIGNSPRSDIAPALDAGIGAVFIPHPHTWDHELGAIPTGHPRLLELDHFAELKTHF